MADGPPFTSGAGNHLLPVLAKGAPAMLKIAGHEEEIRGGALMEYYAGVGAAHVLAREGAAILIERATGARNLARMAADGEDDEATAILCRTVARLHVPRATPLPTLVPLETWFRPLADAARGHGGAFARSAETAGRLLREPRDQVVLHGDLHHSNVLDGGARGWLAIDPKGLFGERGFDYANLFRNPAFEIAFGLLKARVPIVADQAGIEPRRLLQWVLAYAGLGAAWSLEDGEAPDQNLLIASLAAAELGLG